MKQNNKSIYIFSSALFFAIIFVLCGMFLTEKQYAKQVFANENNYDNQTQILDNNQIISSSLWNALKVFYNNNKTDEMPNIKKTAGDNPEEYLTINQFANFPVLELNLSNNQIDNIYNLGIFDLSSFEEIDLSNNSIANINTEFSQLQNLKRLNLSNNQLLSFSYNQLNENCYKTNLETLDISHNKITACDLSLFESADIDASHNEITKENLVLPNLSNIKVNLSYNYISEPSTSNANIDFGLQGIKNNKKYVIGQTIEYYGIDDVDCLKIYFQEIDSQTGDVFQENLVKTINISDEPYTFGLGHYRVEFNTETKTDELQDILVYIVPQKPTIKMFRDGKELAELEYRFSSNTTIKFFGDDNATFAYRLNSGELVMASELKLKQSGIYVLNVYQIIDGYTSDAETLFLEYKQQMAKGWIFAVAGSAIFVVAFYFIIKYYPVLVTKHIGKSSANKKNLD